MSEFDEYKRQGEPGKAEKANNWETAIGLQETDGLKVLLRDKSETANRGSHRGGRYCFKPYY